MSGANRRDLFYLGKYYYQSVSSRTAWAVGLFAFSISLLAKSVSAWNIWPLDQQILVPSFKKRWTSLKNPPRFEQTIKSSQSLHWGNGLLSTHVLSWVPLSQVLALYLVPQCAVEFEFFPSNSMAKLSPSFYFRLFCKGKWQCWKLINVIFYSSQRSISNHCCNLGL